jgi:hypothetical protein
MKVSEYKKLIDKVKAFASSREKAAGPESVVGVQVSNGVVKFIAGTDEAGVVITLADAQAEVGSYGFIVSARPLIESAKVLPAKDNVVIEITKKMMTIVASGGGRLELKAVGTLREAGFPKKPKQHVATASIYSEQWGQMSRLFDAVLEKYKTGNNVNLRFMDDGLYIVGTAMPSNRYAMLLVPEYEGPQVDFFPVNDFWSALKVLDGDGVIRAGYDGFIASTGDTEVFSLIVRFEKNWTIPVIKAVGDGVGFTMSRTDLVSVVRGQAPNDEHNRVTFEVDEDLKVTAFGAETGINLPVNTVGTGIRSVNANYLSSILRAMTDTKEVTLRWGNPSPGIRISASEYPSWMILVAPVALR